MTGSNGLSVIGYFVWWTVSNQRISREDMQQLIDAAGIKDARGKPFRVPEAQYRSSFLKAVREVRGQNKNKGILIQKIRKTADAYLFGLVDEAVNEYSESLQYAHGLFRIRTANPYVQLDDFRTGDPTRVAHRG